MMGILQRVYLPADNQYMIGMTTVRNSDTLAVSG